MHAHTNIHTHTHTHVDSQRLAEHYGIRQEGDDGEDEEGAISAQEVARRWVLICICIRGDELLGQQNSMLIIVHISNSKMNGFSQGVD